MSAESTLNERSGTAASLRSAQRRRPRAGAPNICSARSAWRFARSCWRRWCCPSSASLKTTQEAGGDPADLVSPTSSASTATRAVELPGRPADLSLQQRRHGAPDDRLLPRADHPCRLCAGPLPGAGQGASLRLPAPRPDHPLPGADHADLLHVRDAEADQHRLSASPSFTPRSRSPSASTSCGTASRRCRASWRRPRSSTAAPAGRCSIASVCRRSGRRSSPSRCSRSSPRGTSSSAPW